MTKTKYSSTFQTIDFNKQSSNENSRFKQNGPIKTYILLALVIFTAFSYLLVIFFNVASSFPSIGIFRATNGNISDKYSVNITPAGATFSTWGAIYTWQALWIIYALVSIFIKTPTGYLYSSPDVLNIFFYIFIIANFYLNIGWLFAFANELLWGSFVILLLLTLALYGALVISHANIYFASEERIIKSVYIWLYRAFTNNGLAFYATWVTIATMLNFTIALTHASNVQNETASLISLSIIATILVVYFAMDVFFFEKYMRYTYSTYIQLEIAFAGVLSKHWVKRNGSAIFVLVLAIVAGLMFLTKIILSVYKTLKEKKRRNSALNQF